MIYVAVALWLLGAVLMYSAFFDNESGDYASTIASAIVSAAWPFVVLTLALTSHLKSGEDDDGAET